MRAFTSGVKFGWRTLVRRTGFKTRLRPLEGALEYATGETADLSSISRTIYHAHGAACAIRISGPGRARARPWLEPRLHRHRRVLLRDPGSDKVGV